MRAGDALWTVLRQSILTKRGDCASIYLMIYRASVLIEDGDSRTNSQFYDAGIKNETDYHNNESHGHGGVSKILCSTGSFFELATNALNWRK